MISTQWWRSRAACEGAPPELFDPPSARESQAQLMQRIRQANEYCNVCPVALECGLDADRNHDEGHRGGRMRAKRLTVAATRQEVSVISEPRELMPCGTVAAYRRHHRRGQDPCQACKVAHREATEARRKAHV